MKNLLFILTYVLAMVSAAFAQSSLTSDMSNYNISGNSGAFDVTLSLTTTAVNNLSSFDLFLMSNSPGANNFSVTAVTPVFAAGDAFFVDEPHTGPFATDPSFPSATYVTSHDAGLGYAQNEPISGTNALETLQISYNFGGSPPLPGTIWTISTTPSGTDPGAYKGTYFFSDATDVSSGNFHAIDDAATFTVTVTVVPEPSTWFAGIGAASVIGFTMLRRGARA